jgi:hypothetical protein
MENYLVVTTGEVRSFKLELNGFTVWFDKRHQIVMFLKMNSLQLTIDTIVKSEYLSIIVKSYNLITKN